MRTIGDQARVRAVIERRTHMIIRRAAVRRAAHGDGEGARPVPGIGRPRHRLAEIGRGPGGDVAGARPATPVGYKTAVRDLPPVLARLQAADPRRRVAVMLADACERIGAVKGVDWQGGNHSGEASDGGATTRVKHARRLAMLEALANGWPIDPRSGRIERGPVKVVLALGRPTAKRQAILAFDLLVMVCRDGLDMRQILVRHGWSGQARDRKRLSDWTLRRLSDMAERMGLGPGHDERGA